MSASDICPDKSAWRLESRDHGRIVCRCNRRLSLPTFLQLRPHSSLGYRPPALEARLTETSQGYGKVESKERFPLFHTPGCGETTNPNAALR